jgi:hypothetical protein
MKIPPGNLEIPYGLWISCKIIWFTELESHSIMLLQFNLHSIFWLLPGPYFDFPILIREILNPFLTPFFTWSSISLPTMISKNLGTILILFRENLRQSDFVGLRVLHLFFVLHASSSFSLLLKSNLFFPLLHTLFQKRFNEIPSINSCKRAFGLRGLSRSPFDKELIGCMTYLNPIEYNTKKLTKEL